MVKTNKRRSNEEESDNQKKRKVTSINTMSSAATQLVVGNTYTRIPRSEARQSRSGLKKVHDVTIFVDIITDDPDTVERVFFDLGGSFQPQTFICTTPIAISDPRYNNNSRSSSSRSSKVWRFKTRQQVYGPFNADIKIRGAGGSSLQASHSVSLDGSAERDAYRRGALVLNEIRNARPFTMLKVPSTAQFGIELELTSSYHLLPQTVADHVQTNNPRIGVDVIDSYSQGRITHDSWKIVPDGSIVCNRSNPDCNTFELVSPVLQAGKGLSQVSNVLRALTTIDNGYSIKVNKSMGFHVHVNVEGYSLPQIIKICQNFVKYEEVIDTFMPPSRRTGSKESNSFFQSNRESVRQTIINSYGRAHSSIGNRRIHDALAVAPSIESLASFMNRNGRYHKLNLQNLVTGRQPTIEFRQHSATFSYEKVSAWVRFCIAFCRNSAKLKEPTPFKNDRRLDFKFDGLFQYVVKDRALRDFYKRRQDDLVDALIHGDSSDCCVQCGSGSGSCDAHSKSYSIR